MSESKEPIIDSSNKSAEVISSMEGMPSDNSKLNSLRAIVFFSLVSALGGAGTGFEYAKHQTKAVPTNLKNCTTDLRAIHVAQESLDGCFKKRVQAIEVAERIESDLKLCEDDLKQCGARLHKSTDTLAKSESTLIRCSALNDKMLQQIQRDVDLIKTQNTQLKDINTRVGNLDTLFGEKPAAK